MQGWQKVKTNTFLDIQEIGGEELTPFEYQMERIAFFEDIDIEEMSVNECNELIKKYRWLNSTPKGDVVESINGTPIYSLPLKFGKFIDLNHFATLSELPLDNIHNIVALLFEGNHKDNVKVVLEEPITVTLPLLDMALNWRNKIIDKYDEIFNTEKDEPIEEGEEDEIDDKEKEATKVIQKWMWERILYGVSGGDLTKVPAILEMSTVQVLNWVLMKHELKLE